MEEVAECLIETGGAVLPIVLNDRNVLVATSRKAALAAVRNNIGVSIRLLENLEHAPRIAHLIQLLRSITEGAYVVVIGNLCALIAVETWHV